MTFDELYADEFGKLVRHARRFGADDAAEDVVQDAYVALWELAFTKVVDNPLGALHKIVEHKALDTYRARKRREEREVLAGGFEELGSIEANRDYAVVLPDTAPRNEFRQNFDRAVRGLEGPERDAYILTELRGLSVREAGGLLDTSHMTASRRAKRARLTVRKELA